jgi:hypothetical protein
MEPLSDEEELDMRCAFGDNEPCIFMQFLLDQGWVPDRCINKATAKKIFYKFLRDRDYEKYIKEFE